MGAVMREASLNPSLLTLSPTTSCPHPEAYSRRSIKDWNHEDVGAVTLKVWCHLSRPLYSVFPLPPPPPTQPLPPPRHLVNFHSAFMFQLKGHLLQEAALTSRDKRSGSSLSLLGPGFPPPHMSHAG